MMQGRGTEACKKGCTMLAHYPQGSSRKPRLDSSSKGGASDSGIHLTCAYHLYGGDGGHLCFNRGHRGGEGGGGGGGRRGRNSRRAGVQHASVPRPCIIIIVLRTVRACGERHADLAPLHRRQERTGQGYYVLYLRLPGR
jgi:hypothetical protein